MSVSSTYSLISHNVKYEESKSEGIKVTSYDHTHTIQNQNTATSRRRASTLINTSRSDIGSGSKQSNYTNKDSALIPYSSNNTASISINLKPSRPPKSPFRPIFPSSSFATKPNKRRSRLYSNPTQNIDRKRNNSELSLVGLENLRGILKSFRQSLNPDSQIGQIGKLQSESKPNEEKEVEEGEKEEKGEEENIIEKRRRTTTFGFIKSQPSSSSSFNEKLSSSDKMSLSEQRSAQRLIDELMEVVTPRSPTGSFHSNPSPTHSYFPKHSTDRVRKSSNRHRRIHSSPGNVPTLSSQNDNQSERGRTLSGGTFGKPLSSRNYGGSEGLMSDVETIKNVLSGNRTDGTASAPISPTLTTTSLPPIQLPFIVARRSGKSPERKPEEERKSNLNLENDSISIPQPSSPKVFPTHQIPTPPPLSPSYSKLCTPLLTSPPLITPPELNYNSIPFPPPTSPLPALLIQNTPPHTPSKQSSIRNVTPETHPFAVVVAMMEAGDSPTKRRSKSQFEKESQEILKSPTRKEKGKQREEGERLDGSVGRKQTPRRGFIGPGGIIPRIASRSSLAKLRLSQDSLPNPNTKPVIISIPPSPPNTAALSPSTTNNLPPPPSVSPITPNSTTYLRPAPATPLTPFWSKPRFAVSSATPPPMKNKSPSPSPAPSSVSRTGTPIPIYAPRSGADGLPPGPGSELVEIPRFKKKELNLGIVRRRGLGQRLAWLMLCFAWLLSGFLSLFFDVNVIYILVQCTTHPSFATNSAKSWEFATAAYAVLWAISTLAVWIGWEVGYEFWRRWRLPRPALEPIYSSLPASLHLSLISFNHFTFLLHIRTSPLSTPYSRDIIPETCYALIQLIPGLLPLLPRAAIAVVILISFWDPAADVQAPYGGAVDDSSNRDFNFFKSDSPGQLTNYAKGVLITFVTWIALRLLIVIGSGIGIWIFSGRPLGGLIGHKFSRKKKVSGPPTTPRKPKSSMQPRDPSSTTSPQKSWVDQENEFNWAWRERTRSRIQDAFELCMIRRNDLNGNSSAGRLNSFLYQSEIPWGRMINKDQRLNRSEDGLNDGSNIEMNDRYKNGGPSKSTPAPKPKKVISASEFIDSFVEGKDLPSVTTTPDRTPRAREYTRPESMLDPTAFNPTFIRASPSRTNTAASSSATDLFYTPFEGNTPQTEKSRSVAENIHRLPILPQPSPSQCHTASRNVPPPSSYKPNAVLSEFGVKGHITEESRGGGTNTPDSGLNEGDDESTGLLTNSNSNSVSNSTSNSPRNSIKSRLRSVSNTSTTSGSHSHDHHSTGANSRSSSLNKRSRAYTTSVSPSKDSLLRRTRSSSITLLRESVTNAANAAFNGSEKLIRRARSGTVLSSDTGYSKMGNNDNDEKDLDDKDNDNEIEEILSHGTATSRSRRGTNTNTNTGLGLGLPFAISEKGDN